MFADYQKMVMLVYQQKRAASDLPVALLKPSPAKLRGECLRVCSKRFDRRDGKMLDDFFGEGSNREACLKAIERLDIDRFRPVANFLKGSTENPGEKIIELLAWLIDFQPRPWEYDGEYEVKVLEEAGGEEKVTDEPEVGQKEAGERKRSRKVIVVVVLIVLAGIGIYWIKMNSQSGHCMVWAGDHYRAVACDQQFGDTPVIPLDSEKLAHFKKITRPDTITEASREHIWCAKYNGTYECYTAPGCHPIDTSLILKPLKDYVLINHLRSTDAEKGGK